MSEELITIAVVGDTYVGKTNLIFSYASDEFIEQYITTVSDEYSLSDLSISNSTPVKLSIWDMGGCEEQKSLRKFAYKAADVIIFCFSLAETDVSAKVKSEKKICHLSLSSIKNIWLPEVAEELKSTDKSIKILAGLKSDQLY
jgi:small GTP-binding protein